MSLQDLTIKVLVVCGLVNCLAVAAIVVYACVKVLVKRNSPPENDLP